MPWLYYCTGRSIISIIYRLSTTSQDSPSCSLGALKLSNISLLVSVPQNFPNVIVYGKSQPRCVAFAMNKQMTENKILERRRMRGKVFAMSLGSQTQWMGGWVEGVFTIQTVLQRVDSHQSSATKSVWSRRSTTVQVRRSLKCSAIKINLKCDFATQHPQWMCYQCKVVWLFSSYFCAVAPCSWRRA